MSYPQQILPNQNYKIIDCDLSNHFLIRFIPLDGIQNLGELKDPLTGYLKQEHVFHPKTQAPDLSTSLLGIFEIENLRIDLTEIGKASYNEYCEPNCNVTPPTIEEDYILKSDRHYWALLISKIENVEINYKNCDNPFIAKSKIVHSPMKWNFWHFSIRWELEEGLWHELPNNVKRRSWSNRLAHDIRGHLAMFAKIEEPSYTELELAEYSEAYN